MEQEQIKPGLFYLAIAIVGAIQAIGVAFINSRVNDMVNTQVHSVDGLERKINSNMERQIRQAIAAAIAEERLRVMEGREESN